MKKRYVSALYIIPIALLFFSCTGQDPVPKDEQDTSPPQIESFKLNDQDFSTNDHAHLDIEKPFYFTLKFTDESPMDYAYILLQVNSDTALTRVISEVKRAYIRPELWTRTFIEYYPNLKELVLHKPGGTYDFRNPYKLKKGDRIDMTVLLKNTKVNTLTSRSVVLYLE